MASKLAKCDGCGDMVAILETLIDDWTVKVNPTSLSTHIAKGMSSGTELPFDEFYRTNKHRVHTCKQERSSKTRERRERFEIEARKMLGSYDSSEG